MNTQTLLYENSDKMPEGLYLELMNKLKIDFDKAPEPTKVVIITKSLPKKVLMTKTELVQNIIRESIKWPNREDVLNKIVKMCYWELRQFCKMYKLTTMKPNPQWKQQQECVAKLRSLKDYTQREFLEL